MEGKTTGPEDRLSSLERKLIEYDLRFQNLAERLKASDDALALLRTDHETMRRRVEQVDRLQNLSEGGAGVGR